MFKEQMAPKTQLYNEQKTNEEQDYQDFDNKKLYKNQGE